MDADTTLTQLARTLFAAWGGAPQVDAERLRRFADAVGADELARMAATDEALRRLEGALRLWSR